MAKYLSDIRIGNTLKIEINYGVEKDITGWNFRFVILADWGKTPVVDITTVAGNHALDVPTEGLCYIELSSTISDTLKVGKYYYYVDRIITGSPDDIVTILPPNADYKDKIEILSK